MAFLAGADLFPGRVGIDGTGHYSGKAGPLVQGPIPSRKGLVPGIKQGYQDLASRHKGGDPASLIDAQGRVFKTVIIPGLLPAAWGLDPGLGIQLVLPVFTIVVTAVTLGGPAGVAGETLHPIGAMPGKAMRSRLPGDDLQRMPATVHLAIEDPAGGFLPDINKGMASGGMKQFIPHLQGRGLTKGRSP